MQSKLEEEAVSPAGEIALQTPRIAGIDVARGIALLGILFVNAVYFGVPFLLASNARIPASESFLSQAAYWFVEFFCEGKFFPLFSVLFGAGLVLMLQAADRRGTSFVWLYLRRIFALACFGLAHICFLWPGDILLCYAGVGIFMLFLARRSPKTLFITAAILYSIGQLCMGGLLLLSMMFATEHPAMEHPPLTPDQRPLMVVVQELATIAAGPEKSRVPELEAMIMREGPFVDAMLMRLIDYAMQLGALIICVSWIILACFCTGAGLMKIGFFHGKCLRLRRTFYWLGLFVGFPIALVAVITSQWSAASGGLLLSAFATFLCGPILALFYLTCILSWSESGRFTWLSQAFANLGRMALTGYLLESVLMSFVMLHWGLAGFNRYSWGERFVLTLVVYALVLAFANLWMRNFSIGPMEWVWRCITYWTFRPQRREKVAKAISE